MRIWLLLVLLCAVFARADVYSAEKVSTQIDVSSWLDATGSINQVRADVFFVPVQSDHLHVRSMETSGSEFSDRVHFVWNSPRGDRLDFGYSAVVEVDNVAPHVYSKIPLRRVNAYPEYLKPSPNIDSDHPQVIEMARKLTENEDDMFLAVADVAAWVKDNVDYSLSTLTADVSRPASWVLQNRVGVCDELTSLFVAMLRSLGIPARFVSGVAFTNSPNFPSGWGAHGWAEVYFPGVGWLPYDPTFGQFGYVDPGHVKLKESVDPQESTVRVEWSGHDAEVLVHDLDVDAKVVSTSGIAQSPVKWSVGAIHANVGFGSYNVIIAEVENLMDYYVAGELMLARVDELQGFEPARMFVLRPKERKKLFWKVTVAEDLDPSFQYEIPVHVYDLRNFSQRSSFAVTQWDVVYSEQESDSFIERESVSAPPPLELACVLESDHVLPGRTTEVRCRVENHLEEKVSASVCYGECKSVDISPDAFKEVTFTVKSDRVGGNDVLITLDSPGYKTKAVLTLVQLDVPSVSVADINVPDEVKVGDPFQIAFTVKKESVANPKDVAVLIRGGGAKVDLPLGDLVLDQDVVIDVDSANVYGSNPEFSIEIVFKDGEGRSYSAYSSAKTHIVGIPWYKSIVGWIMGLFGR